MEDALPENQPEQFITDTLVIGAGQAGLAAAYYLQQKGVACILLDAHAHVGDSWATRYDTLRLFSPAWASALPGLPWEGNRLRYPTKDEAAAYLRRYAAHFGFDVHSGQRVVRLQRLGISGYEATTQASRRYISRRVIVCTGGFDAPRIPALAQQLAPTVVQLHSRYYQRPDQLPGTGPVAVVGSGNSALQIAADLAATGRPVYLAFDKRTPRTPNNTLMWLLLKSIRLMRYSRHGRIGARIHASPEPVVKGALQQVRTLPNVHEIGRATAAVGASIAGHESHTPPLEAVVWATGFGPGFNWLDVPVLDEHGFPQHHQGLSSLPGLAFLGLPWLDSRGSALMGMVHHDAKRVVDKLTAG